MSAATPPLPLATTGAPPDEATVMAWIGKRAYSYWRRMAERIEQRYPGVFVPEWLYAGTKHGWSLRYKASRAFCTFVPRKGRFALLIVFGGKERARVATMRDTLSGPVRTAYDQAATYHDGKWMLVEVDNVATIEDALRLLATKRKPTAILG